MKWGGDLSNGEIDIGLSHVEVFDGAHSCVTFMFAYTLAIWKWDEKRKFKEILRWFKLYEKKLVAHDSPTFDSYIILKDYHWNEEL